MNRKFISQKYQHQYVDGSGTPYAVLITAENTSMRVVEKHQGPWKYDGDKGHKILFSITFEDMKFTIISKVKDHWTADKQGLYAKYALTCMEMCDDYEEYYKTALLLTKNDLKRQIEQYEKVKAEAEKKGFWPWPYYTDLKLYKNSHKLNKKTFESIEICEDDLSFFKQFQDGLTLAEIDMDF